MRWSVEGKKSGLLNEGVDGKIELLWNYFEGKWDGYVGYMNM